MRRKARARFGVWSGERKKWGKKCDRLAHEMKPPPSLIPSSLLLLLHGWYGMAWRGMCTMNGISRSLIDSLPLLRSADDTTTAARAPWTDLTPFLHLLALSCPSDREPSRIVCSYHDDAMTRRYIETQTDHRSSSEGGRPIRSSGVVHGVARGERRVFFASL